MIVDNTFGKSFGLHYTRYNASCHRTYVVAILLGTNRFKIRHGVLQEKFVKMPSSRSDSLSRTTKKRKTTSDLDDSTLIEAAIANPHLSIPKIIRQCIPDYPASRYVAYKRIRQYGLQRRRKSRKIDRSSQDSETTPKPYNAFSDNSFSWSPCRSSTPLSNHHGSSYGRCNLSKSLKVSSKTGRSKSLKASSKTGRWRLLRKFISKVSLAVSFSVRALNKVY